MRAVAQRAGIGASTLRHYFPTQRSLLDSVLTSIYDQAIPDERIRDASLPPRVRLIECMWHTLEPIGSGEQSRETWATLFDTFIGPESTEQARLGFIVIARQAQRRVESWLAILDAEGALPAGDNTLRAQFLLTVSDGLSIARALPSDVSRLEYETMAIGAAVDAVLRPFPAPVAAL